MDRMLKRVILTNRQEGIKPDMQGNEEAVNSFTLYLINQLWRKVQSGGRRGDTASHISINGLIALRVL
ncbi:unnamed protein product [marine sediment metagenome]|uniref:Uncharacterized protein n=1 Tax=marine sediment metagenome TaxID=412755 RepID=X1NC34_9ZZZZ